MAISGKPIHVFNRYIFCVGVAESDSSGTNMDTLTIDTLDTDELPQQHTAGSDKNKYNILIN